MGGVHTSAGELVAASGTEGDGLTALHPVAHPVLHAVPLHIGHGTQRYRIHAAFVIGELLYPHSDGLERPRRRIFQIGQSPVDYASGKKVHVLALGYLRKTFLPGRVCGRYYIPVFHKGLRYREAQSLRLHVQHDRLRIGGGTDLAALPAPYAGLHVPVPAVHHVIWVAPPVRIGRTGLETPLATYTGYHEVLHQFGVRLVHVNHPSRTCPSRGHLSADRRSPVCTRLRRCRPDSP